MPTGWLKKCAGPYLPVEFKENLFRKYRFYVACHTNDDLLYILQYGTEDSLMIGTDYNHADQSAEIEVLDLIERRGTKRGNPGARRAQDRRR